MILCKGVIKDEESSGLRAPYSLCSITSFIGREFFVGLSKRTNQRGAEILADTFKVGEKCLCLAQNNCLINIHSPIESLCHT